MASTRESTRIFPASSNSMSAKNRPGLKRGSSLRMQKISSLSATNGGGKTSIGEPDPLSVLSSAAAVAEDMTSPYNPSQDNTITPRNVLGGNEEKTVKKPTSEYNDNEASPSITSDSKKSGGNIDNTSRESPQQRAARLLAMCDQRGYGSAKGRNLMGGSSTLERESAVERRQYDDEVDEPDIVGGRRNRSASVAGGIDRSEKTASLFANLMVSQPSTKAQDPHPRKDGGDNDENKKSRDSNCEGLFKDSRLAIENRNGKGGSLSSQDIRGTDEDVGYASFPRRTCSITPKCSSRRPSDSRSIDGSVVSSQQFPTNATAASEDLSLNVDVLLRRNDRLEDELHRLRTLLSKRTKTLEAENAKLTSQVSQSNDALRMEVQKIETESQSVITNLMERAEHLQNGMADVTEINEGLVLENNRLREENHHWRRRVDELEMEAERAGGTNVASARPINEDRGGLSRMLAGWRRMPEETIDASAKLETRKVEEGDELPTGKEFASKPIDDEQSYHSFSSSTTSSSAKMLHVSAVNKAGSMAASDKNKNDKSNEEQADIGGVVNDSNEWFGRESPTAMILPPTNSLYQANDKDDKINEDEKVEDKKGDRPGLSSLVGLVQESARSLFNSESYVDNSVDGEKPNRLLFPSSDEGNGYNDADEVSGADSSATGGGGALKFAIIEQHRTEERKQAARRESLNAMLHPLNAFRGGTQSARDITRNDTGSPKQIHRARYSTRNANAHNLSLSLFE